MICFKTGEQRFNTGDNEHVQLEAKGKGTKAGKGVSRA